MTEPHTPGREPGGELERDLDRWLADAPDRGPGAIAEAVERRTRGVSQRPGWLARIYAPDAGSSLAPLLRAAATLGAVVAGVALGVQAGLLNLGPGPGTSPSASLEPSEASDTLDAHTLRSWPSGVTGGLGATAAFDALWVGGVDGLARIDPGTGEVIANIPIQQTGCGPVIATARSIWFGTCGSGPSAGPDARTTLRVDPATNSVADVYDDGAADGVGVANIGGGAWFISDVENGVLTRVDEATGEQTGRIEVGRRLRYLTAGFGSLWVSPIGAGLAEVLRIDPESGEVLATITLSGDAGYLTLGTDAIWAAEPHQWLLARIDPTTDRVSAEWGISPLAEQIVLDDEGKVWVVAGSEVVGIEIGTGREVERFAVPGHTWLEIETHPLAAGYGHLWWAEGSVLHQLEPIIGGD